MTDTWTVEHGLIPWYPADGPRTLPLGRNVRHDSRSLAYPWQRSGAPLVSVLHARTLPIFDQGSLGSCTGNAEEGCLGTSPLFNALDAVTRASLGEDGAVALYSAAEVLDGGAGLPAEDSGSSGLSVAQAARNAGLISGYVHCLSLSDVTDALQAYPVAIGINWYDSFDAIPSSGLLSISLGAQVRGGHEPMLRGVDPAAQEVFGDNSWGTGWGLAGSFRMGWATLERLLAEQGDGTVSLPLSVPAPVPVPVPAPAFQADGADRTLWAGAGPWAGELRTRRDLVALQSGLRAWAMAKGL